MAGRIYVAPVVLEERTDPDTGEPLAPVQYALPWALPGVTRCRAAIARGRDGPGKGRALLPWAICYVEADDWTAVDGDDRCFRLDTATLDSTLPNPVRNQLRARGYLTPQEANSLTTIRSAVLALLAKHYPDTTADQVARMFPGVEER